MACEKCGATAPVTTPLLSYETDRIGIPIVIKNSAKRITCGTCNNVLGISIPDMPGLIAAAAITRALSPYKLSGSEIKFLRKAAQWKQKDLADALEVSAETVSRWENGEPIGSTNERILRILVTSELSPMARQINFRIADIAKMKILPVWPANNPPELHFEWVRVVFVDERKSSQKWSNTEMEAA